MSSSEQMAVRSMRLPDDRLVTIVEAGYLGTEHIVPPAGEEWAFDRSLWRHRFEVYASRTGRSVRLWIDGDEIKLVPR